MNYIASQPQVFGHEAKYNYFCDLINRFVCRKIISETLWEDMLFTISDSYLSCIILVGNFNFLVIFNKCNHSCKGDNSHRIMALQQHIMMIYSDIMVIIVTAHLSKNSFLLIGSC